MLARSGALLQQCRDNLGPSPRSLTQQEQNYFRLQPSRLMRVVFFLGIDKLGTIIRDLHFLRHDGRVVWGYLVQANQLLFSPENHRLLPANVIYSPDTYFDDKPEVLLDVARSLFQLKGTASDDKDLLKFTTVSVANEWVSWQVPHPRDDHGVGNLHERRIVKSRFVGAVLANGRSAAHPPLARVCTAFAHVACGWPRLAETSTEVKRRRLRWPVLARH